MAERGIELLPEDECRRRLARAPVGRLAFVCERKPVVLPVNHRVVDGHVVFRSAEGSKLDALQGHPSLPVAFEVDELDPESRTGWSVLVQGHLERVVDQRIAEQLDELGLQSWPEVGERSHWMRIVIDRVSGRSVPPPARSARSR